MPKSDALLSLLGHPITREVMGRISRGEDPRNVASDVAGEAFKRQVAQALGASMKPKPWTHDGMVDAAGDPIDAEYEVIDVTPTVKHRKKAG